MGLVLIAAMFAGCALGLVVSALLGGAGFFVAVKRAKGRRYFWWTFAATFGTGLTLCIIAVHEYPYGTVNPGSDYDVALKNLFLQGLGYCASPGPAALLGAIATLLIPKTTTNSAK